MTVDSQELHALVEQLSDDQVESVTAEVRRRLRSVDVDRPWPPKFFASGVTKGGQIDSAGNFDDHLVDGFGSQRR